MVLVLLGTQHNNFNRLLEEIDKNIENGNIKEEVVVQAGYTKYNSNNMKIFSLTSKENLESLIQNANLIITHAGVGSVEMSLKHNKKVIAVPRLKKYGEHVNDHQKDIEKKFSKNGWVIGLEDVSNLDKAIKEAKKFVPKKYENNKNKEMMQIIKTFIDKI